MAVYHPGRNQNLRDLAQTVRQMVTQAMQNASFGSAGLRVYGGGWIRIENGGLFVDGEAIVSGLLEITGKLIGSGTLDWTGPWFLKGKGTISGDTDITGNLNVKGPAKIEGPLEVTGKTQIKDDLDITGKTRLRGKTTLENDLEVVSGGKIKVGSGMTLTPDSAGGSIDFSNGATIRVEDGDVGIRSGTGQVLARSGYSSIRAGGHYVTATSGGVSIGGLDTITLVDVPSNLLWIDPVSGALKRTVKG